MPDGLTHLLGAYVLIRPRIAGIRLTMFLAGSLLPDIVLRGARLFFSHHPDRDFLEMYLIPLHTPFTCIFICLAISQFLHEHIRRTSFVFLYTGCLSHFIMDMFQRTIKGFGFSVESPFGGYQWLYPFSRFDWQFGLFWPEDTPYALLVLLPLAGIILYRSSVSLSRAAEKWYRFYNQS